MGCLTAAGWVVVAAAGERNLLAGVGKPSLVPWREGATWGLVESVTEAAVAGPSELFRETAMASVASTSGA
jgi:hypothetical protein